MSEASSKLTHLAATTAPELKFFQTFSSESHTKPGNFSSCSQPLLNQCNMFLRALFCFRHAEFLFGTRRKCGSNHLGRQFKVFLVFENGGSNQPDRRTHTVPWRCVFGKAVSDADVDQPYSNQRQGTKTALGQRELSSGRRQQARRNLHAHTHDTSRTSACGDRTQPGDGVRNSGRQRARNLYWRRQQARRNQSPLRHRVSSVGPQHWDAAMCCLGLFRWYRGSGECAEI